MGSYTAQMLIGESHPNEGGICGISHTLYLSEGDRPAWTLQFDQETVTWIPTIENMLEDALLMVGLYIFKDQTLRQLMESYFSNKNKSYIELYRNVHPEHLQEMYTACRQIPNLGKIAISIFEGSTIQNQLSVIEKYHFDFEVCQSIYSCFESSWSGKREVRGRL